MSTTTKVLKELGISEKYALHDYALLNASQKLAEFEQECEAFKKKYRMSFEHFATKMQSVEKEDFDMENDYLAWKFACEGIGFWHDRVQQLKQES